MSRDFRNQLLVNVGSILVANGLILLIVPRRFAALRTSSWTPATFNRGLVSLTDRTPVARSLGLLVAMVGLTMVTFGLMRVTPRRSRRLPWAAAGG